MDDLKKLARWIVENLGPEVPFHILRFHPDYQLLDVPSTPVEVLERARRIALDEGLYYVYIGNVPGHEGEHTYCPKCGEMVIERYGFSILAWKLDKHNRCPRCGYKINIMGTYGGGGGVIYDIL